jgi:hypothetical protein
VVTRLRSVITGDRFRRTAGLSLVETGGVLEATARDTEAAVRSLDSLLTIYQGAIGLPASFVASPACLLAFSGDVA